MLDKTNTRQLAYLVKIDDIKPIAGKDRVECALVSGWNIMIRKNQFKVGDIGIYFEIDSKVPEKEPFMFLETKHFKIKTQRYKTPNGPFFSQGLLMSPSDFCWATSGTTVIEQDGVTHDLNDETKFLTDRLEVTYSVAEDNHRKAKSPDKYKKMAQRNGKLFAKQPFSWLMRRDWGKKLLFAFFGKKRDKKNGWPNWVKKTDEERAQNMPWVLNDKDPWIATEKIDGSSTTFTMKRGKKKLFGKAKNEFYVCSRNVVFDTPDKTCFYDSNIYLEMAEEYNVEEKLTNFLIEHPDVEWVTLQGETYGAGIQKRDYHTSEHMFMGFNFITDVDGRWNSIKAAEYVQNKMQIPWVPIIDECFILPDTIDELLQIATGESVCDHDLREGLVFRSQDGSKSFKAVSNEFLMKYHG